MEKKIQRHLAFLYLSKTPANRFFELIKKNMKEEFDEDFQEQFTLCTFAHRLARQYPSSLAYRLAFIKRLMSHVESQGHPVAEVVYEEYTTLMSQPTPENEMYYITHLIENKHVVTQQCDSLVQDGTTGLRSWEGGIQLFEQIFSNKALFKGKRILELGAGNGFTGIAISKFAHLSGYIFTDHHHKVLQLLKENLRLNGFASSDLIPVEKSLNKFYETTDDEGNVNTRYYKETDEDDFRLKDTKEDFKEETYKRFDSKTSYFLDTSGKSFTSFSDQDLIEKSLEFDEKVNDLSEKMSSFEDFLENFREKLTLIDEKLHSVFDVYEQQKKLEGDETNNEVVEDNENLSKNLIVSELDWSWEEDEISEKIEQFLPDFIVGADIVFDPELIPDLVKVIKVALEINKNMEIIIVCTLRNEKTLEKFDDHLEVLKRYQNVSFHKTQLSPRFSIFKHLSPSTPFLLYNIHNVKS